MDAVVIDRRAPGIARYAGIDRLARRPGLPRPIVWLQLGLVVLFVAAWHLAARAGIINPFFFGTPTGIWSVLVTWFSDGGIWRHIGVTTVEALAGFAIGTSLGIVTGFAFAFSRTLSAIFGPFLVMLNGLPRLVMGPLFVAVFGFGMLNKIALVVVVIFFVIFFNVYSAVLQTDAALVNNAKILGASWSSLMYHVYLPAAVAWIASSLHVSVGLAFSAAIVGEYIGSDTGLGFLIIYGNGRFRANEVYAGLAVTLVIVAIIDMLLRRVERRFTHWRGR